MITQSSELAIKSLIYLARREGEEPAKPTEIAQMMGCSPTYLAKVLGQLVKSGILDGVRGAHGGVRLARAPEKITMLAIIESVQGLMVGNYCKAIGDEPGPVCAFHDAMLDVFLATKMAMARWTLKKLAERPEPTGPLRGNTQCRMSFMQGCLGKGGSPKAAEKKTRGRKLRS